MTSVTFHRRSKLRGLAVVPGFAPTLENLVFRPLAHRTCPANRCKTGHLSDHPHTWGPRNGDSGRHFPHTLEPAA